MRSTPRGDTADELVHRLRAVGRAGSAGIDLAVNELVHQLQAVDRAAPTADVLAALRPATLVPRAG